MFPAGILSPAAETLQTADAAQPRREKRSAIRAQAITRVPRAAHSIEPQKPDSAKISFAYGTLTVSMLAIPYGSQSLDDEEIVA